MKISIYLLSFLILFSCAPQQEEVDEMVGNRATISQDAVVAPDNAATDPNDPSQGQQAQVFGFYSNGKINAASALPFEGRGFTKILRPRARQYASEDLVYIIKKISSDLSQKFPNRRDAVQIGDMSASHGGRVIGHVSHQNGLDVDIAFIRTNETMQDVNDTNGFREIFVRNGKVTPNFDLERNWALAKIMVATGRPQRIFVNAAVKKAFCQLAKQKGEMSSQAETLRRVRPYSNHMDHFHMRLTCPLNSPKCDAQDELPAGTGC